MTKGQFLESIKRSIAGWSKDKNLELHPSVLCTYADIARNSYLMQLDNNELDKYTKRYTETVTGDTGTLPASVVALPGDGGIRYIGTKTMAYSISNETENSVFDKVLRIDTTPSVLISGEDITFINKPIDHTMMVYRLVIPLSEYDSDENIFVGEGLSLFTYEKVREIITGQKKDQINDNE